MSHICPTNNKAHMANSACGCSCVPCLIGARTDLADDLVQLGLTFEERVNKLQKHYDEALDQALKKVR